MRKFAVVVFSLLILCGCQAQESFETVMDEITPVSASPCDITVSLPNDAAAYAMENGETGKLYLCDGYTVTIQTVESGDLDRTLRNATGFSKDTLKIVEIKDGTDKRYEGVWSAAGEGEDQIGRVAVIDDGNYHYVLTAVGNASVFLQLSETWKDMFDTFSVIRID